MSTVTLATITISVEGEGDEFPLGDEDRINEAFAEVEELVKRRLPHLVVRSEAS